MLRRLLPKKDVFFRDMAKLAEKAVEIAAAFRTLAEDIENVETHIKAVKDIEHAADHIAHESLARLHKTFVTPFDRNDIHRILRRLDDVIDHIEAAGQVIFHYDIRRSRPELLGLVGIIEEQVAHVQAAVTHLTDLRHPQELRKELIAINTLENAADTLMLDAMRRLFHDQTDVLEVIKWKEVFELLELATDHCENVADQIENVLLEYA